MKFKSDIQAESKVGIGIASPQVPLHIDIGTNDTGILVESSDNYARIVLKDQFGEGAIAALAANLLFSVGATFPELMRLNGDGNLGIGQTSPSERLVVSKGTDNASIKILSYNNAAGTEAILKFSTIASTNDLEKAAIIARNAAGSFGRSDMHFALDSAADDSNVEFSDTKMTILNGGNVGIGTTSPGAKLDVSGTGRFTDILTSDKLLQIPIAGTTINEGKGVGLSLTDDFPYVGNDSTTRYLNHYGMGIHKPLQASIAGGNGAYLSGYFGVDIFTEGISRIHVNQNGNVGIGTTDPGAKLDVSSSSGGVLRLTSSDRSVATGESIGRVEFKSNDASTGGSNIMGFVDCLATNAGTTYALTFGTGNAAAAAEKMRINPNGNVGIGATVPADKLEVAAANSQLRLTDTDDDKFAQFSYSSGKLTVRNNSTTTTVNQFTLQSDGKMGIGNTGPSYKLDVSGEGRFTGDLRCLSLIQTSQSDKKEFISDIVKTTNKKIEFKEYVYKSDSGNRKRYGVLAEDIEVDYPELVHVDADGVKGVNYIDLLVKRVAELEKELEDISLTEGPKGDTGNRGLRGYTGSTGGQGIQGADGKDGNSHLSDVSSIMFNEKSGQLEIQIGRETYRFNQDK